VSTRVERHHKDGNPLNNDPGNIDRLCRRCHMVVDGRLDAFRARAKANQPIRTMQAAEARRLKGHEHENDPDDHRKREGED
jgi:hypothetical protein